MQFLPTSSTAKLRRLALKLEVGTLHITQLASNIHSDFDLYSTVLSALSILVTSQIQFAVPRTPKRMKKKKVFYSTSSSIIKSL